MHAKIEHTGRSLLIALPKVPARVERYLSQNMFRGVLETQRNMQTLAPKASSFLTNAIQVNQINPLTWELVAATNYGTAVEEGTTGGGMAPVQSILDWIKQKHITPNDPDMDLESLAFLIQRRIQTNGSKAQPFMQPGLKQTIPRLNLFISQGIQTGLHAKD